MQNFIQVTNLFYYLGDYIRNCSALEYLVQIELLFVISNNIILKVDLEDIFGF